MTSDSIEEFNRWLVLALSPWSLGIGLLLVLISPVLYFIEVWIQKRLPHWEACAYFRTVQNTPKGLSSTIEQ